LEIQEIHAEQPPVTAAFRSTSGGDHRARGAIFQPGGAENDLLRPIRSYL